MTADNQVWRCVDCQSPDFQLETEYFRWFVICSNCTNKYEIFPDGTIQLVHRRA